MEKFHCFLVEHHLSMGITADLLTFAGALLLARDAFWHLKELQDKRSTKNLTVSSTISHLEILRRFQQLKPSE